LGLTPLPSATNFLTIDVGGKPRADALLEALLDRGVFVRKPWHAPLDRCIRITIGRAEDIDMLEPILVEALASLAA
jgi:histidinol-phosphate aminotransferase